MSLYDDLGVAPDASARDINAAYRRQAKKHHPDAGGDADQFARINRAAVVLRDPERRDRAI
ncbi:MAG: DnaJ domain-containing protein [Novosphingobium sp.]